MKKKINVIMVCNHDEAIYMPQIGEIVCPNEDCSGVSYEDGQDIKNAYYDSLEDEKSDVGSFWREDKSF